MRHYKTGDVGSSKSSNFCYCDVANGPHSHSLKIGGEK